MAALRDQQGGKGLDVDVAHRIGFVFNVDPREVNFGMGRRGLREDTAPLAAHAAPLGAQADHLPITRRWFGGGRVHRRSLASDPLHRSREEMPVLSKR